MARRQQTSTAWKWSNLSYEMRVMAWWFRNQPEPTSERHPWWMFISVVVLACLALVWVFFSWSW